MNKTFKNILLNTLGAIVTLMAIVVLLLITTYSLGYNIETFIKQWPTYLVVVSLVALIRFFWYNSTENRELTSEDMEKKQETTRDAIDEVITDVTDFDNFLKIETENQRQKWIDNKLSRLTVDNYKGKLLQRLHIWFIKHKISKLENKKYKLENSEKPIAKDINKLTKVIAKLVKELLEYKTDIFEEYKSYVIKKAKDLPPLNSAEFITLIDSKTFLITTKNYAKRQKVIYQTLASITSLGSMAIFSLIAFNDGGTGNWLQSCIYIISMLGSIGQTVITASNTTRREYTSFYRRLITITDTYNTDKQKRGITNGVSQNTVRFTDNT